MRKTIGMTKLFLLTGFLFLFACKKNSEDVKVAEERTNSEVASKVVAWIEEQQSLYNDKIRQKIDSLKKALRLTALTVEDYKDNEKLVIVPVMRDFRSLNNADKSPVSYLVAVLDNGKITKGNLIQYMSPDAPRKCLKTHFQKYLLIKCLTALDDLPF